MTGAGCISSSDRYSRLVSELCTIVAALITPARSSHVPSRVEDPVRESPVTPGAIASLLFGASFAMMICGSVTFVLGFMLMPWVIGFVMLFCFAGFVSYLGLIWRGVFGTTQKPLRVWNYSRLVATKRQGRRPRREGSGDEDAGHPEGDGDEGECQRDGEGERRRGKMATRESVTQHSYSFIPSIAAKGKEKWRS